ncbi:LINE-1 retrotransposable element ORF2 protein [Eumeta japonica]|uniref:LINE-1 retrotransposable element ORF2 protein n=1 Tax=Eumeta variegata TaxID=151549 RepID=A0A4C1W7L2_EUMVA|nr:LINE-1 retrotransposable element ORF2 protein [Eumeta japonica]
MRAIECTGDTDLLLNNLDISLQNGEKENECISIQEKDLLQQLKLENKKVNMMSKTEISLKINKEKIEPILKEETIKSIESQKLDKAPGSDLITNELLKTTLPVMIPRLTNLFNEILETETIPEDWTKSTIILLHKKGDKEDIGNYRPISLTSNIYKIFSKIILNRITNTLDENQPKEQAGFRSKFSTIDHIHTLRQILQKYSEYNKTYHIGFVDFNKAFDTLEHDYIWDAMNRQGVQEKYIRIIKNVYTASTAKVKLEYESSEFPIKRDVRQGDPISPKIFSAVLEMI